MKTEKSCGAIISRNAGNEKEILLIKHKNGCHWAFPKGHVEGDETETQTAIREIFEETGYTAKINSSFRKVVTYSPKKGVLKDVVYFSAEIVDGTETAQPEEVMEIIWKTPEDSLRTVTFDNDKEILKSYIEFISESEKLL